MSGPQTPQTLYHANTGLETSSALHYLGSAPAACSRAISALETQADRADIRNIMCLGLSPDSFWV